MTRIALGVEYDGSNYQGFQKQFEVNSIQQCLEEAVGRIANHKVDIFCAGRTDAGVNATQQVIHFDYLGDKPRDVSSWMRGCRRVVRMVLFLLLAMNGASTRLMISEKRNSVMP